MVLAARFLDNRVACNVPAFARVTRLQIKDYSELDRLAVLEKLEDLLLVSLLGGEPAHLPRTAPHRTQRVLRNVHHEAHGLLGRVAAASARALWRMPLMPAASARRCRVAPHGQVGNPLFNEHRDNNTGAEYRVEVCRGAGACMQSNPRWPRRAHMERCIGVLSSPCFARPHRHANVRHAQVLKRLPHLKKLDGIPVDVDERDQALAARGGAAA